MEERLYHPYAAFSFFQKSVNSIGQIPDRLRIPILQHFNDLLVARPRRGR